MDSPWTGGWQDGSMDKKAGGNSRQTDIRQTEAEGEKVRERGRDPERAQVRKGEPLGDLQNALERRIDSADTEREITSFMGSPPFFHFLNLIV